MRLSRFKIVTTALLTMAAGTLHAGTKGDSILVSDTTNHFSRYDKRIHRYRAHWENLIPTQHIVQFAGNMGFMSVGIGWDYGRHRQWETHFLIGIVPKYDSRHAKMTFTLKQNFIPWSVTLNDGWSFEPLECGLYFNSVLGSDFWSKQPTKYNSGYYPFSTRFRPNVFLGQRITKKKRRGDSEAWPSGCAESPVKYQP